LLVEDEDAVRELARRALEHYGYTVLVARNGSDALQVAKQHPGPLDLLVTDVIMPGVKGRELAQQLLAQRPHLKVLYVSGYTDNAILHHGVLAPGVNFLQKPFTPKTVARTVREVLDRRERDPI
jgi:CheY-like chemotaxis protein